MRALRWRGNGVLHIRHPDGNSTRAAALGAGSVSVVKPFDPETGDSGLIRKQENIRDIGEARIRDLVAAGQLEELDLYDGPERRSGQDRRQGERRA